MSARTSSKPEQRDVFVYDGQTLLGFIDRNRGCWRAVVRGRELGRYQSYQAALAALHEAIDTG